MPRCSGSIAVPPAPAAADTVSRGARAGRQRTANVLGHFRLLRKLGEGGMGTVFQAEDVSNRRIVALKVLRKEVASSRPTAVQRFVREARMMKHIDHPNVLRFQDTGAIDGHHYLVMEYVKGRSVQEHLRERGRWSVGDALHVILACARGLDHAHEQGMIHRDIKPANIMVGEAGAVKVADLGLAKLTETDDELTCTGTGVGTAVYMAPEQFADAKNADRRCDIYGLGCVLYNLLAGELPFKPGPLLAMLDAKEQGNYRPLREQNADVPEALATIVDRMLASKPEGRHATCAEVIAEIEALDLAAKVLSFIAPPEPVVAEPSAPPAQALPAQEPRRQPKKVRRPSRVRAAAPPRTAAALARHPSWLVAGFLLVFLALELVAAAGFLVLGWIGW
jgi:eukaryotic-like serine/threonine-protein kinase